MHKTPQRNDRHDAKCEHPIASIVFLYLLGPKPCKNCESRMSEANPRQSLVKGERLIRYELASAILDTRAANKTRTFKWGRRSGRNLGCRLQKKKVLWLLFANFSASIAINTFYLHERPGHHKFFPMEWPPQQKRTNNNQKLPPKKSYTPAFLLLYLFLFPRRGSRPCQRCQGRARIERRPSKLGRQLAPRKIVVTVRPLRERYIRCHSDKNRYYT